MSANRDELSPLALLRRSAQAYPDRVAVRDGERTLSFAQLAERAWRLGNALRLLGVGAEQRVAMLSLNRLELLEAHFGVPASGGALCAINTRLAPPEVRFIVEHCGAQVLLLDPELEAAGERCCRAVRTARGAARARVRGAARRRRRDAARLARRRGQADLRGLHERHHRHAEGRRLHAPRRVSRRARRPRRDAARARRQLPLDAADVSLQRLVLQLGGAGRRRHERRAAATGARGRLAGAACGRDAPVCGARRC